MGWGKNPKNNLAEPGRARRSPRQRIRGAVKSNHSHKREPKVWERAPEPKGARSGSGSAVPREKGGERRRVGHSPHPPGSGVPPGRPPNPQNFPPCGFHSANRFERIFFLGLKEKGEAVGGRKGGVESNWFGEC